MYEIRTALGVFDANALSPIVLAERQVGRLPRQVDIDVLPDTALNLIQSGEYELSTGLLPGVHYRKERGNGCYHLRLADSRAFMHWDAWDPRRFPIAHFFETPKLWVPTIGVVAAAAIAVREY
jgi:hypothetical protein